MEQITFYLKKFKNLEVKGDKLKTKIIEIIKNKTKVVIKKEEILILKNGTIKVLKIGPEKTEIFLNKKEIEKEIEKEII